MNVLHLTLFSRLSRFKAGLLCLTATLALAGCSSFPSMGGGFGGPQDTKPQLVATPDRTDLMIADAADRATTALESLAAVEMTRTPSASAAAQPIPNAPPELLRTVTFSWAGPVEPVAADIANWAGYTYRAIGDQPPSPIMITVSAYNTPMIEVLRDIGLQMGSRADLKLDANRRAIEIVYASTVNGTPNATSRTASKKTRKR